MLQRTRTYMFFMAMFQCVAFSGKHKYYHRSIHGGKKFVGKRNFLSSPDQQKQERTKNKVD